MVERSKKTMIPGDLLLGQRIRAHREAAGLSLRALSARLPVSAQALSFYEHGRTGVRKEVLEAIANVLDIKVALLLKEPDVEVLRLAQIRRIKSGKRNLTKQIGQILRAMTEQTITLEQKLGCGFPPPILPVMDDVRPTREPDDAEEFAQSVRRRWGLGSGAIPNLVHFFESRGIRVFECKQREVDVHFTTFSAQFWFEGSSGLKFPVILLNNAMSDSQKRFALCCELAHMAFPTIWHQALPTKSLDRYAKLFAGALLLPAPALRDQLGRKRRNVSKYEILEVRRQFGLGCRRIVERCRETEIISRHTYRYLLAQFNTEEWPEASIGKESSTRLQRLAIRAISEKVVTQQEATSLLRLHKKEFDDLFENSEFSFTGNFGNSRIIVSD